MADTKTENTNWKKNKQLIRPKLISHFLNFVEVFYSKGLRSYHM